MNGSRRIGWIVVGLLVAGLAVSCSLYRNDRAWVPESQYAIARTMYIQTGSLDLVQRRLRDMRWRRGRINETIYRLQKEFEVLPEELPAPTQAAAPATTGTTTLTVPARP